MPLGTVGPQPPSTKQTLWYGVRDEGLAQVQPGEKGKEKTVLLSSLAK